MLATLSSPLDQQQQEKMAQEFFREGSAIIKGVLTPEEAAALCAKTDEYAANPDTPAVHIQHYMNTLIMRRCHEMDPVFAALTVDPRIRSIVEPILGKDACFNACNVLRNGTHQAISNWHVDDVVEFPLPPSIARFDARMQMPVFWMTVQVALTDIDSLENGATQFVPGSHYSGRNPAEGENPAFEGRGPVAILCKAGDAYLTNHQCWHRGSPNLSTRTRYLMQLQYARRWADARFKGLA